MKTNSSAFEALLITIMLLPFVYLAIVWNQLPAEIISHYSFQGTPAQYTAKGTMVLVMGGLSVLLYVLLQYLPRIDPKGRLQSANYQKLRLVITFSIAAMVAWLGYQANAQAHDVDSRSVLLVIVSLMLAGIGNYITTVKPNWFVGIRTPWTLESENVWRKTHQMAGRLMVAGGLLSALLAFILPMPYGFGAVLGIVLIVTIVPVIYSYSYYRDEKARQLN